MAKLFLLLLLITHLWANNKNCNFKNKHYQEVCQEAIRNGVSSAYVNEFFTINLKTKQFDEKSWKYLQPQQIKSHAKSEKKANNSLSKYVHEIVNHLIEYKEVYDYAEQKYGVNREIVATILMKETRLGKIKLKHDAFSVFHTIVVRTKPDTKRQKWLLSMGKTNMTNIITYCYKKGISSSECNFPSSYAGAVGITQFMPDSFGYIHAYKAKVGDLTKMEDAIVSASNFLNIKAEFKNLIEWNKVPHMPQLEKEWYVYDSKHKDGSFVHDESIKTGKKYDCFSCQKSELQYIREYAKKIMRYNNSSNYAVGVLRLAYDAHHGLNK